MKGRGLQRSRGKSRESRKSLNDEEGRGKSRESRESVKDSQEQSRRKYLICKQYLVSNKSMNVDDNKQNSIHSSHKILPHNSEQSDVNNNLCMLANLRTNIADKIRKEINYRFKDSNFYAGDAHGSKFNTRNAHVSKNAGDAPHSKSNAGYAQDSKCNGEGVHNLSNSSLDEPEDEMDEGSEYSKVRMYGGGPGGRRNLHPIELKLTVIEKIEQGQMEGRKISDIAKEMSLTEGLVSSWWLQRAEILEKSEIMVAKALKKMNYEENDDEKTYVVAKPKVSKKKPVVKPSTVSRSVNKETNSGDIVGCRNVWEELGISPPTEKAMSYRNELSSKKRKAGSKEPQAKKRRKSSGSRTSKVSEGNGGEVESDVSSDHDEHIYETTSQHRRVPTACSNEIWKAKLILNDPIEGSSKGGKQNSRSSSASKSRSSSKAQSRSSSRAQSRCSSRAKSRFNSGESTASSYSSSSSHTWAVKMISGPGQFSDKPGECTSGSALGLRVDTSTPNSLLRDSSSEPDPGEVNVQETTVILSPPQTHPSKPVNLAALDNSFNFSMESLLNPSQQSDSTNLPCSTTVGAFLPCSTTSLPYSTTAGNSTSFLTTAGVSLPCSTTVRATLPFSLTASPTPPCSTAVGATPLCSTVVGATPLCSTIASSTLPCSSTASATLPCSTTAGETETSKARPTSMTSTVVSTEAVHLRELRTRTPDLDYILEELPRTPKKKSPMVKVISTSLTPAKIKKEEGSPAVASKPGAQVEEPVEPVDPVFNFLERVVGVEEEEDGDDDDTSDVNIVTLPQDESQTMFDSYDAVIFESSGEKAVSPPQYPLALYKLEPDITGPNSQTLPVIPSIQPNFDIAQTSPINYKKAGSTIPASVGVKLKNLPGIRIIPPSETGYPGSKVPSQTSSYASSSSDVILVPQPRTDQDSSLDIVEYDPDPDPTQAVQYLPQSRDSSAVTISEFTLSAQDDEDDIQVLDNDVEFLSDNVDLYNYPSLDSYSSNQRTSEYTMQASSVQYTQAVGTVRRPIPVRARPGRGSRSPRTRFYPGPQGNPRGLGGQRSLGPRMPGEVGHNRGNKSNNMMSGFPVRCDVSRRGGRGLRGSPRGTSSRGTPIRGYTPNRGYLPGRGPSSLRGSPPDRASPPVRGSQFVRGSPSVRGSLIVSRGNRGSPRARASAVKPGQGQRGDHIPPTNSRRGGASSGSKGLQHIPNQIFPVNSDGRGGGAANSFKPNRNANASLAAGYETSGEMYPQQNHGFAQVEEHQGYVEPVQHFQQNSQPSYTSNLNHQTSTSYGYTQSRHPTQYTQSTQQYGITNHDSSGGFSQPESSNLQGYESYTQPYPAPQPNLQGYDSYTQHVPAQQPQPVESRQRVSLQVTADQLDVLKSLGII